MVKATQKGFHGCDAMSGSSSEEEEEVEDDTAATPCLKMTSVEVNIIATAVLHALTDKTDDTVKKQLRGEVADAVKAPAVYRMSAKKGVSSVKREQDADGVPLLSTTTIEDVASARKAVKALEVEQKKTDADEENPERQSPWKWSRLPQKRTAKGEDGVKGKVSWQPKSSWKRLYVKHDGESTALLLRAPPCCCLCVRAHHP